MIDNWNGSVCTSHSQIARLAGLPTVKDAHEYWLLPNQHEKLVLPEATDSDLKNWSIAFRDTNHLGYFTLSKQECMSY